MANVLVTGASGFLGWHMVRHLRSKGHWVRGVDKNDPLWVKSDANEFIKYDLRDIHDMDGIFDDINWVVHFAADEGGIDYKKHHKTQIIMNNAQMDSNVLELAFQRSNVSKILITSSVKVDKIKSTDEFKSAEEAYLTSKFFLEKLCKMMSEEYSTDIKIARLENVFGPFCHLDDGREKNIASICKKVYEANQSKKRKIEMLGDGYEVKRYIYIDDVVSGLCKYINSDYSRPLNFYGTKKLNLKELIEEIKRFMVVDVEIDWTGSLPANNCADKQEGYDATKWISWNPKSNWDESLEFTLRWINSSLETGK